jgi:hypothetical protein
LRLALNEQINNHGYSGNHEIVMNLADAMLAVSGLEAFLSEWWAQDVKNKTQKGKDQRGYTPQQVYDCAIFDLAIHIFDIQSGWRDAFERQHSTQKIYIKGCKISTCIWITSPLSKLHGQC